MRSARLRAAAGAALILLAFLLPQAVPNLPVYVNIARVFYEIGLDGTILGVVLVHASHGLVLAVWIASAAFASVDGSLEEAARNIGASPWTCFRTVTLPLAAPGLMASAIFVFLESLDEFTGTYFVGVPDVTTLPLLMFNASMGGNYQIASITALLLLVPSIGVHARRRALPEGRRARRRGQVRSKGSAAFMAFTAACVIAAFVAPPVAQPLSYHDFAYHRTMFGVPNSSDFASNIAFLLAGVLGLAIVAARPAASRRRVGALALRCIVRGPRAHSRLCVLPPHAGQRAAGVGPAADHHGARRTSSCSQVGDRIGVRPANRAR